MQKPLSLIFKYKFTIIICAVVLFLSLLPSSEVPNHNLWNFYGSDKIVHFLMYFALSFTLFFEKHMRTKSSHGSILLKKNLIPVIILIISSGFIELIQPPLANRSCELFDFIANALGVIVGFYLLNATLKLLKH